MSDSTPTAPAGLPGVSIVVPVLNEERHLEESVARLLDAATPGTRMVLVNSPNNPTGTLPVDGTVPTVLTISYDAPGSTVKVGDLVTFTVNMSEAVTVTGTPTIAVSELCRLCPSSRNGAAASTRGVVPTASLRARTPASISGSTRPAQAPG